MAAHELFEQLCALATTGEITADEVRRLQEHLHECPRCRSSYRDFHLILGEGLPALVEPRHARWTPGRSGLKKRFIARARKDGIGIADSGRGIWRTPWMLVPAGAALIVLLTLPAWRSYMRPSEADEKLAVLSRRVAELERVVSEKRAPAPVQNPQQVLPAASANDHSRELANELLAVRNERDAVLAEKVRLTERVGQLSSQLDQLQQESRSLKAESASLAHTLAEAKSSVTSANQDLESLRSARSLDAVTIAEQRTRLDQLAAKVREQAEVLSRERDLLAAAKDVRDLMGARNMRIAELVDVGGPRRRAVPGRVFYSREMLIYYAFDLENRGDIHKVAFQVWGKREGRSHPPRSLGLLSLDDAREKKVGPPQ